MSKVRHVKEIILLTLFLLASFAVGIVSFLSSNPQARNTTSAQAASNIDNSCKNGIYYVKNPNKTSEEISCGRGVCGGVSYEGTANINWESAGKCWKGNSDCGPACQGLVPLCCYKMAETGDAEDCPFPERKYCRQDQCKKQTKNNDSNCGSGISTYCVDIPNCLNDRDDVPILSLEDRLAGKKASSGGNPIQPTNTPIPQTNPPTQSATQPTQVRPTVPDPTPTTNTRSNVTTTPVIVEPTQNTQQPSPTTADTFVFDFKDKNESGNFGNNPQQQDQSQQNNTNPVPTNSSITNSQEKPIAFSLPQIEIKSPKQVLRDTLDRPTIEKMNVATEKPLAVAKDTFITVKSYDQQLENTVESWFFKIRVSFVNFLQ